MEGIKQHSAHPDPYNLQRSLAETWSVSGKIHNDRSVDFSISTCGRFEAWILALRSEINLSTLEQEGEVGVINAN